MDRKQVLEHEEATKIKTIDYVQVGFVNERLKTWYFSPFPQAFHCDTPNVSNCESTSVCAPGKHLRGMRYIEMVI